MGTKIIQQRRGKGSPSFRAPSHRFLADVKYDLPLTQTRGQVMGFADDPARSTLLAVVLLEDGRKVFLPAPEGLAKGDEIILRANEPCVGNVMELGAIPDGTPVFNIEITPGDGGKLARASGACAYVVGHDEETGLVAVRLASKEVRFFDPRCLATIGVACGGGRTEKPFKKAGTLCLVMRARNKYYPRVRGTAMNPYDHPHGGKSFGKTTAVARGTPPGRKVGHIAARRSGRRKGRVSKISKTIGEVSV